MKLFKIYESILHEETSTGIQACANKFGKELFADQLGGTEPNTSIEDRYHDLIAYFTVSEFGHNLNHETVQALKDLQNCVSAYPEVLYPEGTVYRGTQMRLYDILQKYQPHDMGLQITYKAKSVVQSWTDEYNVSTIFGSFTSLSFDELVSAIKDPLVHLPDLDLLISKTNIGVILHHTATPDQFLFKGKYLNKLGSQGSESEVLRVGNDPIECIATFPNPKEYDAVLSFLIKNYDKIYN
jgi:hypothetical protein